MKINVIIDKKQTREMDVDRSMTLAQVADLLQKERPYRILLARVCEINKEPGAA